MTAYYNEIDPYAAQWLRNLIEAGHIAPGIVDERSIEDVRPEELMGYTQCHFFAGIGVWSHALRRAGWSDDRPVWTGSCPCQPFSAAGKGKGFADERHLWPSWFHLIEQCRPSTVFGEQVGSKDGLGWLDLVQADLEGLGYACGAIVAPAAGFGAPHIRERLYFVANADKDRCEQGREVQPFCPEYNTQYGGSTNELADAASDRQQRQGQSGKAQEGREPRSKCSGELQNGFEGRSIVCELANADNAGLEGYGGFVEKHDTQGRKEQDGWSAKSCVNGNPSATNGFWGIADWLYCRDGKWRAVESGTFPLVDGVANRMGFSCAECEGEVIFQDEMCYMRKKNDRYERRKTKKVLQSILYGESVCEGSAEGRKKKGAISYTRNDRVQSLRLCKEFGETPQGRKSKKQPSGEFGDFMSEMSCETSQTADKETVQSMLDRVYSSAQKKQHLFCPLCSRVGTHKCEKTMVKNRAGRLRAYGNAIVAPQAQAFIETAMEYRP